MEKQLTKKFINKSNFEEIADELLNKAVIVL